MHALIILQIFCCVVDEKVKLKVLACFLVITYGTNVENVYREPPVTI